MGTTGPDYMGIGMGPRARPGFVQKLYKKTCNFDTPPRALRGGAFMGLVQETTDLNIGTTFRFIKVGRICANLAAPLWGLYKKLQT